MKDSEGELNRLLDGIRIEIEENGGQLEVIYDEIIFFKDLKKSEEIRKRELIQEHRDEQLKKLGI